MVEGNHKGTQNDVISADFKEQLIASVGEHGIAEKLEEMITS